MKTKLTILALVLSLTLFAFTPNLTSRPLIYRAVIAQEDQNAPYEAFVYENTLNATLTFSYQATGLTRINANKPVFTYGKTFFNDALYNEGFDITNLNFLKYRVGGNNNQDTIYISNFTQNPLTYTYEPADNYSVYLEILVYP